MQILNLRSAKVCCWCLLCLKVLLRLLRSRPEIAKRHYVPVYCVSVSGVSHYVERLQFLSGVSYNLQFLITVRGDVISERNMFKPSSSQGVFCVTGGRFTAHGLVQV